MSSMEIETSKITPGGPIADTSPVSSNSKTETIGASSGIIETETTGGYLTGQPADVVYCGSTLHYVIPTDATGVSPGVTTGGEGDKRKDTVAWPLDNTLYFVEVDSRSGLRS